MNCDLLNKPLEHFAQQHEQSSYFIGAQGMRIHTLRYDNNSERCVLIAPGRAEVAFKYRELAYDLWQLGYAVAVIDHRGQGFSQRFFADMQLGHMDDFEHAVSDLHTFTRQLKQRYRSCFLIAHSMGSAISSRLLQRDSALFNAAAISCPMLSLASEPIPAAWAAQILTPLAALNQLCWRLARRKPRFISRSRGESAIEPFAGNRITSSPERYAFIQEQLAENSSYAVGGPTAQWAAEAFRMMQQVQQDADKITTPLLILQGGKDRVVTPEGQHALAIQLRSRLGNRSQFIHIADGLHELLMERDPLRNQALAEIELWFARFLTN